MTRPPVCPHQVRRDRARRNGRTLGSFLCPCQWGPGLVNETAIVLLVRQSAADHAWYERMWTLAGLFVDTPTR